MMFNPEINDDLACRILRLCDRESVRQLRLTNREDRREIERLYHSRGDPFALEPNDVDTWRGYAQENVFFFTRFRSNMSLYRYTLQPKWHRKNISKTPARQPTTLGNSLRKLVLPTKWAAASREIFFDKKHEIKQPNTFWRNGFPGCSKPSLPYESLGLVKDEHSNFIGQVFRLGQGKCYEMAGTAFTDCPGSYSWCGLGVAVWLVEKQPSTHVDEQIKLSAHYVGGFDPGESAQLLPKTR